MLVVVKAGLQAIKIKVNGLCGARAVFFKAYCTVSADRDNKWFPPGTFIPVSGALWGKASAQGRGGGKQWDHRAFIHLLASFPDLAEEFSHLYA